MGRLPNWFILGAARCGTTTLWHALNRHPQIFLSPVKEPSFFCEPYQLVGNPIAYAELFAGVPPEVTAVGEASHAYLTHPRAATTLRTFFPDARFVLIFRNPADRAFSLYTRLWSAGYERHPTFERALAAEDRRFASPRFAHSCPQYFWNYLYFRSGLFGEQVARYFDVFPSGRFYATTLYSLVADPARILGEIHDFLGVGPEVPGELPRLDKSVGIRSTAVEVLNRKYLLPLAIRGTPGIGRLRGRLQTLNASQPPRVPPETRAALLERFRPDLDRLRELTGVDVLADEHRSGQRGSDGAGPAPAPAARPQPEPHQ